MKETKITDGFYVHDIDSAYYNRVVPQIFGGKEDDRLMWSLIMQYAVEGNTKDHPNGHFYLTARGMESVAREVITTHYGWTGNKREFFLRDNLPKLWAYHDVLNEGFIDVAKGAVILKSLVGDVELNNGLQLQVGEDNMQGEARHPAQSLSQFRPNPIQSPWAVKPDPVDLNKKPSKIEKAFTVQEHGHPYYNRVVPLHFQGPNDDRLMHSLITQYALEGNTNGQPNGHFYMTKELTEKACDEVIGTHYQFDGDKKHKMVQEAMDRLWPRYDVNEDGFIEVQRAAVFLREAIGEVETAFGLQ